MLAMLAMLVGGCMAKQGGAWAGLQGGGGRPGGLASTLDLDRDGSGLDVVIGLVGRLFR